MLASLHQINIICNHAHAHAHAQHTHTNNTINQKRAQHIQMNDEREGSDSRCMDRDKSIKICFHVCSFISSLQPLMKTNADDSLFSLPLWMQSFETHPLCFSLLFYSHLLPHSRPFLPSFYFLSLIKEKSMNCNCFEYTTCVCIDLHTDIPLFHWFFFAFMQFSCIGKHIG